jgi:hypothetical protein
MGKCYNFLFDSTLNSGGANNKRRHYATNWASVLPEGKKFKVSFTFCSESDSVVGSITFITVPVLRCNLGQSSTYANLSTNSPAFSTTNALGFLKLVPLPSNNVAATADEGYLLADRNTNSPIYLEARPQNPMLEIEIHDGLTETNYASTIPDYICTLHFEEYE